MFVGVVRWMLSFALYYCIIRASASVWTRVLCPSGGGGGFGLGRAQDGGSGGKD